MKTKEEILSKVKEIIVDKIGVDEGEVTLDANLRNDLGCDSLDIIEIAMEIEEEYKVEITGEKLVDIHTVGDLWKHTFDKLEEKSMTVQPVEKVVKKESNGLISAEEMYSKSYIENLGLPLSRDTITELIKKAQRNAIEVALEEVKDTICEVTLEDECVNEIQNGLLKQIK